MAEGKDRTSCIVVGCFAVFFVAFIGVFVAGVVFLRGRAPEAAADDPPARGPMSQPWSPCSGTPAPEDRIEEALAVSDVTRVDLGEVFARAQALALRLEPSARLTSIAANQPATEGTYDLAAGNLSIHFEYRCLDSTKPPGADKRQGQAFVFLYQGKMRAERIPLPGGILDSMAPLQEPPCGTAAAWRAVVASGVVPDARATFVLSQGSADLAGETVWIVAVPGHPEYSRQVDAARCLRVTENGRLFRDLVVPPAPPPKPAATPIPPPTADPATSSAPAPSAPAALPGPRDLVRPIEGDLKAVEIQALLPAAQALAEELRPGAQLVGIVASRLSKGTADLRPNNLMTGVEILYQFEYSESAPGAAGDKSGAPKLEGSVNVTASRGTWTARWRPGAAWKLHEADFRAGPLDPPKCSSVRVWRAANSPDRAVTYKYVNEREHHPRTPNVWKVDLGGRVVFVDDRTCGVVAGWE